MSKTAAIADDPIIGRTLGETYLVEQEIDRGGMGRVYRGLDVKLNTPVAIKLLDVRGLKNLEASDAAREFRKGAYRQRFLIEAEATAKLTHPNTVRVFDYGEAEDCLYMAMEFLDGETLARTIRSQAPIAAKRVVHIGRQICNSLQQAHELGLIHRDLKPGNIMLIDQDGDADFVKVLDFGLAKDADSDDNLTQSGALLGTPRYMAPEQIAGGDLGPPTDIYGLGAVLYHALTGRAPIEGETKYVLLAAQINVDPTPMNELGVDVDPRLEAILLQCLRKSAKTRYDSMRELEEALAEIADDVLDTVRIAPVAPSLPDNLILDETRVEGAGVLGAPTPIPEAPKEQKPWLRWAIPAALLLVIGGVGWFMQSDSQPPTPITPPPIPATTVVPAQTTIDDPKTQKRTVEITSSPEHITIYREDLRLGETPMVLELGQGETWTVKASKKRYADASVQLSPSQKSIHISLKRKARRITPNSTIRMNQNTLRTNQNKNDAAEMTKSDNRNPWAE